MSVARPTRWPCGSELGFGIARSVPDSIVLDTAALIYPRAVACPRSDGLFYCLPGMFAQLEGANPLSNSMEVKD